MVGAGLAAERFALDWASAAEAPLFVRLISEFTQRIKDLGPLGKVENMSPEELKLKLAAARAAAESIKLRTRFAKLTAELRRGNRYEPEAIEAKMAEKLNDAIVREIQKQEKSLGDELVNA